MRGYCNELVVAASSRSRAVVAQLQREVAPVGTQLVKLVVVPVGSIVAELRRVHLTFILADRKRIALAALISF